MALINAIALTVTASLAIGIFPAIAGNIPSSICCAINHSYNFLNCGFEGLYQARARIPNTLSVPPANIKLLSDVMLN